MTAAKSDRRSDLESNATPLPWADQPAIGNFKGLTWWMAVLAAVGPTIIGTLIDALAVKGLGITFQVTYVLGCVAAIVLVQRRSLFGPMVQPPLVMVLVTMPILLLFAGGSGKLIGKVVELGQSLVLSFPAMAVATVLTLGIGITRLFMQRKPTIDRKAPTADSDSSSRLGPTRNRQGNRFSDRLGSRSGERPADRSSSQLPDRLRENRGDQSSQRLRSQPQRSRPTFTEGTGRARQNPLPPLHSDRVTPPRQDRTGTRSSSALPPRVPPRTPERGSGNFGRDMPPPSRGTSTSGRMGGPTRQPPPPQQPPPQSPPPRRPRYPYDER